MGAKWNGEALGTDARVASDDMRRFFNPALYRIIMHDQRGAGKSRPYACLEENTTKHLIDDIETLRCVPRARVCVCVFCVVPVSVVSMSGYTFAHMQSLT